MEITEAVDAAQALVRERFPEAVAAFLGGSLARGEGTDTSDLDVVVIRPAPAEVYRETLVWRGRPAEVFVHTPESVRTMFAWDRANGVPTMASLCADSLVLRSVGGAAEQVASWARDTLRAGPRPLSADALALRRYTVTDLRDDLLDCRDADERLAVAALLHVAAGELLLAAVGAWSGKGKWLARRLRAAAPDLGGRLLADYRALAAGGPAEPLGATVTAVLDLAGGPLLAGDRRTAGPSLLAGPAD
ncbi:nucleotidyltransferase domain-containing protein [Kitasatospora terrestris]|uniref:Nucleotidyltransferase domain-containing protein n=1 Tax=Kitasatospora terrestris TaxID=258051 RepID=A0ABP9EBT1_9ACTN